MYFGSSPSGTALLVCLSIFFCLSSFFLGGVDAHIDVYQFGMLWMFDYLISIARSEASPHKIDE